MRHNDLVEDNKGRTFTVDQIINGGDWLPRAEAARLVNRNTGSLINATQRGYVRHVILPGGVVYVYIEDVHRYVQRPRSVASKRTASRR